MAKRKASDPVIEGMLSVLQETVSTLITHAMMTGGPDMAIDVINRCISGMDEQKDSINEVMAGDNINTQGK